MINVLVTGADGMLGKSIQFYQTEYSKFNFYFTNKAVLDISDKEMLRAFVRMNNIAVIVNCAAYTNVEKAEFNTKNANRLNFKAVQNLAEIAKQNNCGLIHISTDYVFDGESQIPYNEEDITNPQNVYGITKLKGEQILLEINPKNTIIIRTSWLYGEYGSNFVKTISNLASEKESISVVNDQIGSPTYAKDLAKTILDIIPQINNSNVELLHYTNKGSCSWFDFATEIVKNFNLQCEVKPVSSDFYPTEAKRPKFSLLDTLKIEEKYHVEIPEWKSSLKKCIENLESSILSL
ncbi:dTDP-4-dehydrorhamnose reductase [Lutibacter sp. TH_r2]|uniref:dTDP-4-dehydrorhamnose reductase n=1 Tax=Lutibacter sp. TH_r2 TaxID=3082083 RepID=UPI002954681D|nr:dTDP-4-dehydrorhamnose reductase [Lutibacter sp. TH_r2]MDV7187810.1 dTDP-4-dehydrorhamnose reductase [Lutibacter sp. TH_r2]